MPERYDIEEIEAYLDGTLSPEDSLSVEQRMQEDSAFANEVRLHRDLSSHFSDPGRANLQNVIREVISVPPVQDNTGTTPPAKPKVWFWVKWLGLGTALVLAAWWILEREPEQAAYTPSSQQPFPPPPTPAPEPEEELPFSDEPRASIPDKPQKTKELVAEVDPSAYETNPSMEALMTGMRGDELDVTLNKPANQSSSFTRRNGITKLTFEGAVSGGFLSSLSVLIYGNQDANQPIQSHPLPLTPDGEDAYAFSSNLKLNLPPGLYYFVLTNEEDGSEFYIGKFSILNP